MMPTEPRSFSRNRAKKMPSDGIGWAGALCGSGAPISKGGLPASTRWYRGGRCTAVDTVGSEWCRHTEKQVPGDGSWFDHGIVTGKESGRHLNRLREQKSAVLIEDVAEAALRDEHVGIRVEVFGEQVH